MMRILYIEDNEINRFVFEKLMKKHAEVSTVADGPTGVELCELNCYELVVIDINLDDPNYDGFDVLNELNGLEYKKRCGALIFALTAFSGDEWEKKCMNAGFDAYFAKPVNPSWLINKYDELKK